MSGTGKKDFREKTEEPEIQSKKPRNLFDKTVIGFYSIICLSMSAMLVALISVVTMLRYLLKTDLYGYEEWVRIFAFWLYFTGAAYGAFAGTHISADLVQAYMKTGVVKRTVVFLRTVVTFGVTLFFTWYGYDFLMFGILGPLGTGVAIPKSVAWKIPLWTAYLPVFIGLLSMSCYFLRDMVLAGKTLFLGGGFK